VETPGSEWPTSVAFRDQGMFSCSQISKGEVPIQNLGEIILRKRWRLSQSVIFLASGGSDLRLFVRLETIIVDESKGTLVCNRSEIDVLSRVFSSSTGEGGVQGLVVASIPEIALVHYGELGLVKVCEVPLQITS